MMLSKTVFDITVLACLLFENVMQKLKLNFKLIECSLVSYLTR